MKLDSHTDYKDTLNPHVQIEYELSDDPGTVFESHTDYKHTWHRHV